MKMSVERLYCYFLDAVFEGACFNLKNFGHLMTEIYAVDSFWNDRSGAFWFRSSLICVN